MCGYTESDGNADYQSKPLRRQDGWDCLEIGTIHSNGKSEVKCLSTLPFRFCIGLLL